MGSHWSRQRYQLADRGASWWREGARADHRGIDEDGGREAEAGWLEPDVAGEGEDETTATMIAAALVMVPAVALIPVEMESSWLRRVRGPL
jgi:hypothetical protein